MIQVQEHLIRVERVATNCLVYACILSSKYICQSFNCCSCCAETGSWDESLLNPCVVVIVEYLHYHH